MARLRSTLAACEAYVSGQRPTLHCVQAMDCIMVAADYPFVHWLNDHEVPLEQRQHLLSMVTRSAALVDDQSEDAECRYSAERAIGLTNAWSNGGMAVSLASASPWDTPWLSVELHQLRSSGDIETRNESLRHASLPSHVHEHAEWIRELYRVAVRDGRDLWDKRAVVCPNLEFCTEIRRDLAAFKRGDPALAQILKRLKEMDEFFAGWDGAPIAPSSLPSCCTPESGETLKAYENAHTFTRASGERRVFSWHVRFTPGAGRIFFDGDAKARKGIVGCIVRNKLPTVKYPT